MFSDSLFLAGFDEYLERRLSANAAPTYTYLFDFTVTYSISRMVGGGDFYFGVCHGDDIAFLFPFYKLLGLQNDCDKNCVAFRDALVEMWVNFAIYG